MNLKNKEVRAYARHLLDDNIFGKDWVKGALVHVLIDLVTVVLSYLLSVLLSAAIVPAMLALAIFENSAVLYYGLLIIVNLVSILITCIIAGPIRVGTAAVYIDLVRGEGSVKIRKFFYGFRNFFSNAAIAIMYVLQVFLWLCVFIIPGIYVAYSYALVFYVKRDHPEYNWKSCFDESERLMEGNRFKLFKLQMSHIGWFILALAFVFFGAYWTAPYINTSEAIFYEKVRAERSIR